MRKEVLIQAPELSEIVRIIEEKRAPERKNVSVVGELLAWNVKARTFLLIFPEGEPISGHWADEFDGAPPRKVPGRYRADLIKETTVNYATENDEIKWLLANLREIDQPA